MDKTDNKLVITPKDDRYVTMTIRTEKEYRRSTTSYLPGPIVPETN